MQSLIQKTCNRSQIIIIITKTKDFQMLKTICKNAALTAAVLLSSAASQAVTVNGFANGGFEEGTAFAATNWSPAAMGYTISGYSHTGSRAMRLSSPAVNAAIGQQNSIEDGGLVPLTPGDNPLFSFWITGEQGSTGNVNYALRYLDDLGNILADSGSQQIGNGLSWNSWTQITYDLGVVPVGATTAFLEIVHAIGPIGTGPGGEDWTAGTVIIDDVYLGVEAPSQVPVPAAAWLFGSALLGLVGIKRKKTA
jgi:hypothetical protein